MHRLLTATAALLLATTTMAMAAPGPQAPAEVDTDKIGEDLAAELEDGTPEDVKILMTLQGPSQRFVDEAEAMGVEVRYAYEHIPTIAGEVHERTVQDLARQPWVQDVTEDHVMHTTMNVSRVEALAPQANSAGFTGDGVNVAVVDTGIDKQHPALDGRVTGCVKIEGGVHYPVCDDDNGHGTHVAGTIGAQATSIRPDIKGIAPQVTYSAVKVLNSLGVGLTSDVIEGMEWVINHKDEYGIRVMSMSLGGETCGDGTSDAAQMADQVVEAGIVAVIAAGNSGPGECTVTVPGTAEKVITVGAVDDFTTKNYADDHIADFSSRGPTKDGRTKPDVVAPGVDITSTYLSGTYAELSGTSMATPHVSGVVAALLEEEPSLTPSEVKDRVHSTAIDLASSPWGTVNNHTGWGFIGTCDLLGLTDCSQPAELTDVHAGDLTFDWRHYGQTGHRVETAVPVADAGGSGVGGATVEITTTAPDGTEHDASGTTGSDGTVTLKAQQKENGHGTWESCVDTVWGEGLVYTPGSNVETCDTVDVAH